MEKRLIISKKPFKCMICDVSFSQKYTMKKHIAAVHEGNKPYKCDTCDASFAEKLKLTRHIRSLQM